MELVRQQLDQNNQTHDYSLACRLMTQDNHATMLTRQDTYAPLQIALCPSHLLALQSLYSSHTGQS